MSNYSSNPQVVAAAGAVAGVALYALAQRAMKPKGGILAPTTATTAAKFEASATLSESESLTACGTMLICTQNLAVSGANQVALNIVEGHVWRGNVVVLSPSNGPFAKEFADLGVAVWIGGLDELLKRVRDVRVAICNTIMTAHLVNHLTEEKIPSMWILHEWWPEEMMIEELSKRNDKNTTPAVVKKALATCPRTVCVCKAQHDLYKPTYGAVTYVGVPEPAPDWKLGPSPKKSGGVSSLAATTKPTVTFLCLGIVCPRKNQHFSVEVFQKWAGSRKDVKLIVVGARYIRQYEIDYVEKVKATINGDPRIELHDVTNDVDQYYRQSDALLFTSLNEVTPMVIAEAMMRSLPVVTTDIAGIPEMLVHGVHGFVHPPEKHAPFVKALEELGAAGPTSQRRRLQMGAAARKHAVETFTNAIMVSQYRAAAMQLAPPVILVDMDGCLVDWDKGFAKVWGKRSPIDRKKSYAMEMCVPESYKQQATEIFHAPGFFLNLPPMAGGVKALHELAAKGYRVFLCTSPVTTSPNCAGEKFEWVRANLGPEWVPRIIITSDKTAVRGDVLIDDKPAIKGAHHPVWQQLMFDAPYNLTVNTAPARISSWDGLLAALDAVMCSGPKPTAGEAPGAAAAAPSADEAEGGGALSSLRSAIAALPDFSHLLPPDYRKDYAAFRGGAPKGAKGELSDALAKMEEMQDSVLNNTSEEFTEVSVFRAGYASWRRGRSGGAKGNKAVGAISQL
jgi:5'-nucleotidase